MSAAAQVAVHRLAADVRDAVLGRQQPRRGDDLPEPVARHRVQHHGILLVPLQRFGNVLLFDEHRTAQRTGAFAQRGPVARLDGAHGLARLVAQQHLAQCRRNRLRGLRRRIGEHVDQLAADEKLVLPEQPAFEHDRRVADAHAAHADVEHVVDARRCAKVDRRLAHVQVAAHRVHRLLVRQRQRAPVVGDGGVEVHQVVRVEDDLLHVDFGPAHAQAVEEAEVLAFVGCRRVAHGVSNASLIARAASSCACSASGIARPILMNSWITPR